MPVAFDAVSTSSGSSVNNIAWTHTPSGTPTAVAVIVYGFGIFNDISATYGGAAMTRDKYISNAGTDGCALFSLANPAAGAQTVSASWTGSGFPVAGAITVTGSDTTTAFTASASASGNSTAQSVTVSSTNDDLVIEGGGQDPQSGAPTAGGTSRWSIVNGGERGVGQTVAGSSSVTATWTWPSANPWLSVAGSFKAAASGSAALTTSHESLNSGAVTSNLTGSVTGQGENVSIGTISTSQQKQILGTSETNDLGVITSAMQKALGSQLVTLAQGTVTPVIPSGDAELVGQSEGLSQGGFVSNVVVNL